MSFISVLVWPSRRLLIMSTCEPTFSYCCSSLAIGRARPNSRASRPGFWPADGSGMPRSVVTISLSAWPAAPVSLLRTPSSISSATVVTASCAPVPKKRIELLSSTSISAIA